MNIIGITGYAGSGKDTVANILCKEHGFVKVAFADPLKRICKDVFDFTDEQLWGPSEMRNGPDLRYMVSPEYAEAAEREKERDPELSASYAKQGYLTPRHALQQLGTEWGRACYRDVWVNYALRIAAAILSGRRPGSGSWPWYTAKEGLWFDGHSPRSIEDVGSVPYEGVVISDVRFPNEIAALKKKGAQIWRTSHGHGLEGAAALHQSEQHIDKLAVDFIFPKGLALDALPRVVKAARIHEHWRPAWHNPGGPDDTSRTCEDTKCVDPLHYGQWWHLTYGEAP